MMIYSVIYLLVQIHKIINFIVKKYYHKPINLLHYR
jgi:hypothetical protein